MNIKLVLETADIKEANLKMTAMHNDGKLWLIRYDRRNKKFKIYERQSTILTL